MPSPLKPQDGNQPNLFSDLLTQVGCTDLNFFIQDKKQNFLRQIVNNMFIFFFVV